MYIANVNTIFTGAKYHAASGNTSSRGDYAAMNNEYTPILNNAGTKYLKLISASIIERF